MSKKKNFITILLIICFLLIITGCGGTDPDGDNVFNNVYFEEPVHEEIKISNYPFIEESVEKFIEELSQNDAFNNITFVESYKDDEGYINVCYKEKYNSLVLSYNNGLFYSIELYHDEHSDTKFNKSLFMRQMMAIAKLEEFDINENDFYNNDVVSSYDEYLKIMNMEINEDNVPQFTTSEKNLLIFVGGRSFSIIKESD